MTSTKILHVIDTMDPKMGGVCQSVRMLIPNLSKVGVYSEVVSLDEAENPFIESDNFSIHALGLGQGPWYFSKKLLPWLLENMPRFDTVILHGLWRYHAYALHKAWKILEKQAGQIRPPEKEKNYPKLLYLVMPHGMLDPYFQKASGRKIKAIRNWAYWKLIERHVINHADAVLFSCEEERIVAHEPFRPYHPKREIVWGLGVENPPFYKDKMREAFLSKCPEAADGSYILFLSRIHKKKGLEILLEGYSRFIREFTQSDPKITGQNANIPRLIIAGPGLENDYGTKIREIALNVIKDGGLISFPGMLTGDAKWGAFYGCEAFVLTSHQENFGIAIVEALSCSKPVFITYKINIWREIDNCKGGLTCNDSAEGVQKIFECWNNLEIQEKLYMGMQARVCFEKNFAIRPAVDRLLNVITTSHR